MKAIILAAGMGTRLGTLIPKPLTPLKDEKTILDYQIEKLSKKIGKDNIILIIGYKKEIIMEHHHDLIFVYNAEYAHTNTAKSLLKAAKKVNEDFIWVNGDVFFDEEVIDLLINSEHSACLVDNKKCSDEEIRYTLNEIGGIHELSKQVKGICGGEAVGINLVKKKDIKLFIEELEKVAAKDYFEKALENLTLSKKLHLKPIHIKEFYVKEIDFPEDLAEVRKYLDSKE